MRALRTLLVLASLGSLAACTSEKYSQITYPSGEWTQANAYPDSTDNNIIPLSQRAAAQ
jgi:hypothetical protein